MTYPIPGPLQNGSLGLIAGNGQLPLTALGEAIRLGIAVTVAAIEEETDPQIEELVQGHEKISLSWLGVGQLGKLLKIFGRNKVDRAMMIGQVKHVRIFAPSSRSPLSQLKRLPDRQMLQVLASLKQKNTSSLIDAIVATLEKKGIRVLDSTLLLQRLIPAPGNLTRQPTPEERQDWEYGAAIARKIAALDLGQTIVVKNSAVVAVEAMEGTDATIRRACSLVNGERLSVVKVSRPFQDMRYDVPVIGKTTLKVILECNVSALWIEAGRTLILDREEFLTAADQAGVAVTAFANE